MKRGVFIINLLLVSLTAFSAIPFAIYALLGLIVVGAVQLLCALVYFARYKSMPVIVQKQLRIYGISLLILIVITAGCAVLDNSGMITDLLTTAGLVYVSVMALHFTYITWLVSQSGEKNVMSEDDDVLDREFIQHSK